jgi:hypothetical protein
MPTAPRPRRLLATLAVSAAAVAGGTGCITGERPTLAEGPVATGDAAIDAVLSRLDAASASTFGADYDLLTRFGDLRTEATVAQDGPARRSVTVGAIRFLTDGATTATCDLDSGTCSDTIDAARISDTQQTPDFYAISAAARLRRDAGVRSGPTVSSTETIAGQPAACVVIPLAGAESTYCALDSGALARVDAADVLVELTSWSPTPDPEAFARPS